MVDNNTPDITKAASPPESEGEELLRDHLALDPLIATLQQLVGRPLHWDWNYPEEIPALGLINQVEGEVAKQYCLCCGGSCGGEALVYFQCGGCNRRVVALQLGLYYPLFLSCRWQRQRESWQRDAQRLTQTRSLREALLLFENREAWLRLTVKWEILQCIKYITFYKNTKIIAFLCERKSSVHRSARGWEVCPERAPADQHPFWYQSITYYGMRAVILTLGVALLTQAATTWAPVQPKENIWVTS